MCACELHAPICQGSQAVWHCVNGNFCLLLCAESKLSYEWMGRKERENTGREGEAEGEKRNRWSRWGERDKGRETFLLRLFLMHLDAMM